MREINELVELVEFQREDGKLVAGLIVARRFLMESHGMFIRSV
jgi:hypothetical protein